MITAARPFMRNDYNSTTILTSHLIFFPLLSCFLPCFLCFLIAITIHIRVIHLKVESNVLYFSELIPFFDTKNIRMFQTIHNKTFALLTFHSLNRYRIFLIFII